jgi:hypothetical protein
VTWERVIFLQLDEFMALKERTMEIVEEVFADTNGLQKETNTKLAITILFMNLCTMHGVINKFSYEFFTFLRLHLLHVDTCLPQNYYVTKTLTKRLGLDYKNIHACGKGCVLFQGEYRDVVSCPKCGAP